MCLLLQYLQHVGCPAAVRTLDAESQLLWLLRLAVAREYEDNSEWLAAVPTHPMHHILPFADL